MGPSDPFARLPEPPPDPPGGAAPPPPGPTLDGGVRPVRRGHAEPAGRGGPRPGAVAVGAIVGLVAGLVTITVGFGPALVVLVFAAVGAAVGAVVRAAAGGGVDVPAAWRALRRRP